MVSNIIDVISLNCGVYWTLLNFIVLSWHHKVATVMPSTLSVAGMPFYSWSSSFDPSFYTGIHKKNLKKLFKTMEASPSSLSWKNCHKIGVDCRRGPETALLYVYASNRPHLSYNSCIHLTGCSKISLLDKVLVYSSVL